MFKFLWPTKYFYNITAIMSVLSVDQSAVTVKFIERASPGIDLTITSLDLFPPYMRGLAFFLFTHGENRNKIKDYLDYKLNNEIPEDFYLGTIKIFNLQTKTAEIAVVTTHPAYKWLKAKRRIVSIS